MVIFVIAVGFSGCDGRPRTVPDNPHHNGLHGYVWMDVYMYRQVSNMRRTKSRHFKDSHTVLWLSLPNPLKPDVKSRMKM